MRPVRLFALVLTVVLAIGTATAYAWYADFFYDEANGNGTYEAGFINPEAVYDDRGTPDTSDDKTFVVFQGPDLDPYIAAVDNDGDWEGPRKIGENQLSTVRPLDTHGGPAIVIDHDGFLHVFFGGHNSKYLQHAMSPNPRSINGTWDANSITLGNEADFLKATYPQPWVLNDGRIGLVYRRGQGLGDPRYMDWEVTFRSDSSIEPTWTPAQTLVDDSDTDEFYISTDADESDNLHIGIVRRDKAESGSDQFVRKDVYYIVRDANTGVLRTVNGTLVAQSPTIDDLEDVKDDALVESTDPEYANQVVVRVEPGGNPSLLYLRGAGSSYQWTYRRWADAIQEWPEVAGLPSTDHGFDAADLWYDESGDAYAYVTTGGRADDQATPEETKLAARGGDLVRYHLPYGASSWGPPVPIKPSLAASARYNNPQVYVADGTGNNPGVLFTEWNNDASSFIHKMFLYRHGVFVGKEFTPEIVRLAGDNRIETAVDISREAFPSGTDTIVLASSQDYADALCGVPLAHSYRAPVLLSPPSTSSNGRLPAELESEIKRLKITAEGSRVILLGGEKALSPGVMARVKQLVGSRATVERIAGLNRYETSLQIARRLRERKGQPGHVVLASGANFADALAASPYAARRGIPVLLTSPTVLPPASATALRELAPEIATIAGGPVAVQPAVETAVLRLVPETERVAGANRFETAAAIADMSFDAGHTLERPVVASGATFADAVPGGLLAARYNSVVLLTTPGGLAPASENVLRDATRVLEAYILGGPVAVSAGVQNRLAAVLMAVEAE